MEAFKADRRTFYAWRVVWRLFLRQLAVFLPLCVTVIPSCRGVRLWALATSNLKFLFVLACR